jgi:hypothetical protein
MKKDAIEMECDGMDCVDVAQDSDQWLSLVNTVTNLRVPSNDMKFWSS